MTLEVLARLQRASTRFRQRRLGCTTRTGDRCLPHRRSASLARPPSSPPLRSVACASRTLYSSVLQRLRPCLASARYPPAARAQSDVADRRTRASPRHGRPARASRQSSPGPGSTAVRRRGRRGSAWCAARREKGGRDSRWMRRRGEKRDRRGVSKYRRIADLPE